MPARELSRAAQAVTVRDGDSPTAWRATEAFHIRAAAMPTKLPFRVVFCSSTVGIGLNPAFGAATTAAPTLRRHSIALLR